MNKLISMLLVFCTIGFYNFGCRKDKLNGAGMVADTPLAIQSFDFVPADNKGNLTDTVKCIIQNDTITGYYPLNVNAADLVAQFNVNIKGAEVAVNGIEQVDNSTADNFTKPVVYTISSGDTASKNYIVILKKFTGLPIVNINTNNQQIYSKDIGVNGTFSIDSNSAAFASYSGSASFYIHGNTTASYPKVPYKVILSSKAALLGMPSEKKWVLLANYDDRTLIRNYIAFKISRIFGMFYTPQSQFAELILNGKYVGNYQLTEQIDIDKNRLNINKMADKDISGKALTGGYLIEGDNKHEEDDHMRITTSLKNNSFIIHDPEDSIAEQTSYIAGYLNSTEEALYSNNFTNPKNGYTNFLSPESFVEYFWVNEISRNNDAGFWSSTYLYNDKDSLLNMGPVWDFDIAFGNTTYNNNQQTEGWYMTQQTWFNRLFQDSAFVAATIAKWQSVQSSLDSLPQVIDDIAKDLHESEIQNFEKWNIMTNSDTFAPNTTSETAGSYQGEIDFTKNWIQERISWINNNIESLYQNP